MNMNLREGYLVKNNINDLLQCVYLWNPHMRQEQIQKPICYKISLQMSKYSHTNKINYVRYMQERHHNSPIQI